jgi:hypothetical protein
MNNLLSPFITKVLIIIPICLCSQYCFSEETQKAGTIDSASSSIQESKDRKSYERVIKLNSPVEIVGRPYYHGSGLYAFGGLAGGIIASHTWKDEPERIAAFVQQEKIDIAAIVKEAFEKQLNAKPEFLETYKAFGPSEFKLRVVYGIASVPFSEGYRPYLSIRARLVDLSGNVKWEFREYMGKNGKANAIPYPDFFKSDKVFQEEFEVVAEEVVSLLLGGFHN